jgi:hypothetical protein
METVLNAVRRPIFRNVGVSIAQVIIRSRPLHNSLIRHSGENRNLRST